MRKLGSELRGNPQNEPNSWTVVTQFPLKGYARFAGFWLGKTKPIWPGAGVGPPREMPSAKLEMRNKASFGQVRTGMVDISGGQARLGRVAYRVDFILVLGVGMGFNPVFDGIGRRTI